MSTNLTSSGRARYSRLVMMLLSPTLLPLPVAPAMSRWGMAARSVTAGLPRMSFPSAMANGEGYSRNLREASTSRNTTGSRSAFGISIPTTALPGMGATMRTLTARITRARSSARLTILFTLTPLAGSNSYIVMTGPGRTWVTRPSTPKSRSFISRISARLSRSSCMVSTSTFGGSVRRASGGSFQARGLREKSRARWRAAFAPAWLAAGSARPSSLSSRWTTGGWLASSTASSCGASGSAARRRRCRRRAAGRAISGRLPLAVHGKRGSLMRFTEATTRRQRCFSPVIVVEAIPDMVTWVSSRKAMTNKALAAMVAPVVFRKLVRPWATPWPTAPPAGTPDMGSLKKGSAARERFSSVVPATSRPAPPGNTQWSRAGCVRRKRLAAHATSASGRMKAPTPKVCARASAR